MACGGAPSPVCSPRAPLWQRWQPIFRPLGSPNRARTPRRLCALRSRSAPAEARTTGSNRLACSRCVPTFSRGGFGTEKKCDFQIGQLLLLRRPLEPIPPGADMPPTTSSDAEGFRRCIIAFRKLLGPLLKARISAFRPALRFTDFNGHIACGHERGHGRSISRGNKRSGGGHSAQCRDSWLPSVLHVPVALWGSNRRSEAKAAKIICQLHPPPRPTCVRSPTVRR